MTRIASLICLLLAASACQFASADEEPAPTAPKPKLDAETEALLQKMEKQAKKIESISCDFALTRYSHVFEEKSVKSGKLYYRKPELVRIDFEKPDKRQFFVNQERWYDYRPEANYVRTGRRDKKKSDSEVWALDLWKSPEKLRQDFAVKLVGTEKKDKQALHLLEVTPRDKKTKTEYIKALFWIDEKLYLPVRIKCFEKSEDTVTYEFKKMKINPKLSTRMFRFKVSRDMIVEDVDEQPKKK